MEINFEYWLIDLFSFIDISTQLSNTVPINCYEILSFNASITSIIIPNWTCNINNYTVFDFSRFSLLESIEIGNNSFGSVSTFQIIHLHRERMEVMEMTNRNHSTYWIVNHWNPFKLVNIVSVIMEVNLNWRI